MLNIKKTILKYLPIDKFLFKKSYSQEGEDMVLQAFYEGKKKYKGYYIDIGAHHPYRFSNTLYFYKKGWKGINVEPTPSAIKLFKFFRSRDINLNIGISDKKDKLNFYCFNEPALNGFSKQLSDERNSISKKYKIIRELEIDTYPLAEVLDKYLPQGQQIDFLTIDVEGLDMQVLLSNNWAKYRPLHVLVEDQLDFANLNYSEIYTFLEKQGYQLVAKTLRTLFFRYNKA